MGKTDEEIAFQYTLTGYLQLIEEDNEYRKSQDQVSILLTSYKQLFCTQCYTKPFSAYSLCIVTFWQKEMGKKLLVKCC